MFQINISKKSKNKLIFQRLEKEEASPLTLNIYFLYSKVYNPKYMKRYLGKSSNWETPDLKDRIILLQWLKKQFFKHWEKGIKEKIMLLFFPKRVRNVENQALGINFQNQSMTIIVLKHFLKKFLRFQIWRIWKDLNQKIKCMMVNLETQSYLKKKKNKNKKKYPNNFTQTIQIRERWILKIKKKLV